ncbi:hypothetical protein F4859DRAFT_472877 [Xylaria cf. heliscus]|nr:hypothetical protein F4859DRAFT_472877 [Xylaria cf. heliscus]
MIGYRLRHVICRGRRHVVPVLSLVGLIRVLRPAIPINNSTTNGLAPAATVPRLPPTHLENPIMQQGSP